MEISLTFTRTQNRGGESVVFLHALGSSGGMWQAQQQALSDYDCMIPDLPGHGRNHHIPWVSLQETARLMATLIERNANGGQAHLVGSSLGSYVIMEMLANHKKVVRRAVISGIQVIPDPHRWLRKAWQAVVSRLMKTSLLSTPSLNLSDEKRTLRQQALQQLSPPAFRAASQEMATYTLPTNASDIQTPTLVVAGGNQHPLVLESLVHIGHTLPFASAYMLPFTGQNWIEEKPALYSDMLKAWLKSDPVPDSLIPASADPNPQDGAGDQQPSV